MKKHSSLKRILAVCLSLVMVLSLIPGTARAAGSESDSVTFEKIDPSEVSVDLRGGGFKAENKKVDLDSDNTFKSTDRVRVMIVLPGEAAISLVSKGMRASDPAVTAYREDLQLTQKHTADVISREALDGEKLDVVWNLTLVANAISANVEYGQIEDIAKVNGVKAVYLERRYEPMTTGEAELNNIPAQGLTGAAALKDAGYTGAGMRIAVIDTGTARYHQSFDGDAFEHSLKLQADEKGLTLEEYMGKDHLNLLTEEEIAEKMPQLNAGKSQGLEEEDAYLLYKSSKLPFGYNYIDSSISIDHVSGFDEKTGNYTYEEHGSHVAGIAAANTYIPDGNGGYTDAATAVGVTGVAPDAQIITMKVFGANGGAYTSDNFAAIEDAMVLDCDVVNLSLGSSGGFVTAKGEYRIIEGDTSSITEEDRIDAWVDGIMDRITEHGIIMSASAGNSGNWAEGDDYTSVGFGGYTSAMGMMYTDEGGTYNVGSPSTFHNTMSVASADNVGGVSQSKTTFTGNGSVNLGIYSTTSMSNPDWATMDTNDGAGTEYDVVFLGDPSTGFAAGQMQANTDKTIFGGYDEDDEPIGSEALKGKIVMISRGTSSFFEKRDAAAAYGAAAVICYNHTPGDGVVSADLTGTTSRIPFGGLSYEDGKAIFDVCKKNEDGLYVCKATVYGSLYVNMGKPGAMPTMSSYSSWGTTGALTMKPEITAPGGSIYSVNGGEGGQEDTDQYENMSGTSMAAPHFSGLVALTKQYIRSEGVLTKAQAVAGKSLTERQLAQSLLMSTADPLVEYTDEDDNEMLYSVRNQGAGLANVQKATSAESFILVNGQPDGKVKAELGDGTTPWKFTFTINNLTGKALTYDLSAQMMTTGTYYDEGYTDCYFSTDEMVPLDARVSFSTGSTVTVPANGSAAVTATVTVSKTAVNQMKALGYTNGFYVEGYVFAEPVDTTREGVQGVTHSIPMLGWYGNWTDISMFDGDALIDTYYPYLCDEDFDMRLPHVFNFYSAPIIRNILMVSMNGADPEDPEDTDWFIGNLYDDTQYGMYMDTRYIPARNALNNDGNAWWQPTWFSPMLMRNAAAARVQVKGSDGTVYYNEEYLEPFEGAYAHGQLGVLMETTEYTYTPVEYDFSGIPEGTDITLSFSYAPEYYENSDGSIRWDDLGKGATMSFPFRIDNTAPELVTVSARSSMLTGTTSLSIAAKDSNYIAFIAVLDASGAFVDLPICPDMDENQRGQMVLESFDLSLLTGNKAIVALCDYAGNESFYRVNLGEGEYADNGYGDLVAFQSGEDYYGDLYTNWVSFNANARKNETPMFSSNTEFGSADYVNGVVYAQDVQGWLHGIWYEDMVNGVMDFESARITHLPSAYQDMAYNYSDGMLYGVYTDDEMVSYVDQIDLDNNCEVTEKFRVKDVFVLGLAFDDGGTPYLMGLDNGEGTAKLYVGVKDSKKMLNLYDLNGDHAISILDVQALMDHVIRRTILENLERADFDDDGQYTTADVHLFLNVLDNYHPEYQFEVLLDTEQEMNYRQSMTWDHNNETLYWARFNEVSAWSTEADLWEIDVVEETYTRTGILSGETYAMFAPLTEENAARDAHSKVPATPSNTNGTPVLVDTALSLAAGGSRQLAYDVAPWYADHVDMTWSSSDETVATVSQSGLVTAVGVGTCTITVANADDAELKSTCTVTVVSPELTIKGTYSEMGNNIGQVSGSRLYTFTMDDGMMPGPQIMDYAEDNYGSKIGAAVLVGNSPWDQVLWACEWGNMGLIRQIQDYSSMGMDMALFGEVTVQPIGGEVTWGLTYSPETEYFTGIANNSLRIDLPSFDMYPSVDIPLIPEKYDDPIDDEGTTLEDLWVSEEQFDFWHEMLFDYYVYDPEAHINHNFWHELDFSPDLIASNEGYVTGENGQGATTDIVLCGITDIGSVGAVTLTKDYLGGSTVSGSYTPDTTMVLLDNVGRLWYVDELTGMTKDGDTYTDEDGNTVSGATGIHTWKYADDNYSVFVIREIVKTPLNGMYLQGTMPRYTYHFSDIYYAGTDNSGNEVYLLSLYDYHNNGTTNQLYLLIMDENGTLIELGDTGDGNVIATIYDAVVDMDSLPSSGADAD